MTLRGWRERMSPRDGGLEAGGERHIPGLRREEPARPAGMSVDYLVLLEQGRAQSLGPSGHRTGTRTASRPVRA
ncbi:hypothetical protein [Streptomyces sp. MBT65]|uniref:hypothetical protein n=1 Tax=Streptomyces sp. MBT65 TaxID=1488395 RepID=UPI001F1C5469|nr:hypothetical protein [Streptomyces sp. MBT65]